MAYFGRQLWFTLYMHGVVSQCSVIISRIVAVKTRTTTYRAVNEKGQVLDSLDVDAEAIGAESIQNALAPGVPCQRSDFPLLLCRKLSYTCLHHGSFLSLTVLFAVYKIQPDNQHGKTNHDGFMSCHPMFGYQALPTARQISNLVRSSPVLFVSAEA